MSLTVEEFFFVSCKVHNTQETKTDNQENHYFPWISCYQILHDMLCYISLPFEEHTLFLSMAHYAERKVICIPTLQCLSCSPSLPLCSKCKWGDWKKSVFTLMMVAGKEGSQQVTYLVVQCIHHRFQNSHLLT